MPCDPLIDPACLIVSHLIQPATSATAGGILGGIAQAISGGVRWIVTNTAAWWIQVPSPNLASEPAIGQIQGWLFPVTAAVAVACMIGAGLRMAITRRANPLLDVAGGLVALAVVTTIGVVVPALLLKAGDAWSSWVLQVSTGGHFTERLGTVLTLGGSGAPAVVIVLGLVAIVMSLIQAVLMLFRQITLVILAGVLPLAAAGTTAPATRPWLRKVSSWMLALICYKPAAAAVYAAAFTMIGSGSIRSALMGFVTLLLSIVMLPALMKFFTWAAGSVAGQAGGGQFFGAAAAGAVAVGAMRAGPGGGAGSAAADQAAYLDTRLGSPDLAAGAGSATGATEATTVAGAATAASATGATGAAGATAAAGAGSAGATAAGTGATAAGTATAGAAAAGPAGLAAAAAAQAAQAAATATQHAIDPDQQS